MFCRHGSWNQRNGQPLQLRETHLTSLGLRIRSDEGGKPFQEHPRRLESESLSLYGVTVQTVITTTSDESKKASFDSIMCEKELQGLKTTSTEMVEKTWSEDEINNQNGMKL